LQLKRILEHISFIVFFLLVAGCAHVPTEKPTDILETSDNPYLNMLLARDAENRGNWNKALEFYGTIDDPFSWLAQARINFILNQSVSSLEFIDILIEEGSYADEALELRTKIYARKGDWEQAIADTETLADKYPENKQLLLFLANLKIVVADFEGAREILEALLGSPDDSMTLYTLSKACLGAKDFDCSKKTLGEVIELRPKFTPAYLDLGKTHMLLNEKQEALEVYEQLLEIDPTSNDGLIALSELYISEKRYTDAISLLEELKKVNPNVQIIRKLVMLKLQEDLLDDALADLAQIEEKTAEDKYYQSIALARLKRFKESLDVLDSIDISDSGLGCDVALLKSTIFKESGNKQEAISVLLSAWEAYSDTDDCSEVGYQLAIELDNAGRREEGLEIAMKLLDTNPHDPVALNFAGYIWADEGIHLEQAYDMIKEALAARPQDPYILDSMAWVLFKTNRSEEALEYLKKALDLLDSDPIIHEHMGDILKSLGKNDEALDYYIKSSILKDKKSEELQKKINDLFE
jgi:tetratricopeptide (TPR) repeat protein